MYKFVFNVGGMHISDAYELGRSILFKIGLARRILTVSLGGKTYTFIGYNRDQESTYQWKLSDGLCNGFFLSSLLSCEPMTLHVPERQLIIESSKWKVTASSTNRATIHQLVESLKRFDMQQTLQADDGLTIVLKESVKNLSGLVSE